VLPIVVGYIRSKEANIGISKDRFAEKRGNLCSPEYNSFRHRSRAASYAGLSISDVGAVAHNIIIAISK